jgi:hypothetical protein
MERTALLDLLSEFLMVEQGGLELYRVAAVRCTDAGLSQRYAAFGEETARHRELLVRLIERLGGDPAYVSPTARQPSPSSSCARSSLSPLVPPVSRATSPCRSPCRRRR